MATFLWGIQNSSSSEAQYLQAATLGEPPGTQDFGWYYLAANAGASATVNAMEEIIQFTFGQIPFVKGPVVMSTSAGSFAIWDNGNWQIMYQSASMSAPEVLMQTTSPGPGGTPEITIIVNADGTLSGTQNN